ncbi:MULTISPECIES: hypothetical protein [unclassified Arcicella]|uniref:hypothetical protein n=1 Tax=unclassified Arcicella TaxID=2644986 RepID=UPI002861603C|nr:MULTISPECIES: hypothetical protein [unclassified Arcicella]MDR6564503.1 putative integral membrane protein [Arcicella sp. BE51]MDR6814362.1 putative integral membrane protein [Arcicella sp. BE140]MDR6825616.1 putative integral membrane protein [Arcicella sp. BE139]
MKEEEIFDILDGLASEETIIRHQALLINDETYRSLFQEYADTHALLEAMPMEKTAVNFTDKLIDQWELSQVQVLERKPSRLPFYFLIGAGVILIASLLVVFSVSNLSTVQVDLNPTLSIIRNKVFINSLLTINSILILKFLDKKFLKPYFEKKYHVSL